MKYSLSQLLLWLVLSAHIQWPFRTSTPSQREIFSLTAVIVACSLCSYTVAFQDQHTLQREIVYSLSQLLLWLALSARIQWPFRTSTPSQSEIFSVIVAVRLCKCRCRIFHFGTRAERASHNNSEARYTESKHIKRYGYCVFIDYVDLDYLLSGVPHPPKVKYSLLL